MFALASLCFLPLSAAVVVLALLRARKHRRPPLRLAVLQIVLCLAVVATWFGFRTAEFMAEPTAGDLYAHDWGFQAVMFVLIYLPWTLLASGALVLIESVVFQRRSADAP